MKLLRDIWELVDGPKPPRTRKKSKWLSFSWRGIGVIVLLFLVVADLPPQPVIVTDELSFEVVNQMEEAGRACRSVSENSEETDCAGEVWKACHLAKQDLDNSKEITTGKDKRAVWYLCDHAVTVDAGDLGLALASRYENEFFGWGWFITVKTDEGRASFLLFIDLIKDDLYSLYDRALQKYISEDILIDQVYVYAELASNPGHEPDWSRYLHVSDDTEEKLLILLSSIKYYLSPYRDSGSVVDVNLQAIGMLEWPDLLSLGDSRWEEPSGLASSHEIIEQNCAMARLAARENRLGWVELLDRCFQLADDCANRADSFSVSCSLTKGAAEFESMWQRLPEVCAPAEGNDEQLASAEKTSNIEEPTGTEEPAGDACYQAALAICEYQNVSPDDEWIDQLISMRDFACTAAARTPDLQYVKIDDRVPYYRVPYRTAP